MEESHPQEVDIYANIIQNRRFQLPHVALASTMEGSSFQMLQLASKIEGSSCKMLQITCEKESSDYTMLQIICKIEDSSFKGLCIACKMMANRMQSVRSPALSAANRMENRHGQESATCVALARSFQGFDRWCPPDRWNANQIQHKDKPPRQLSNHPWRWRCFHSEARVRRFKEPLVGPRSGSKDSVRELTLTSEAQTGRMKVINCRIL